MDARLLRYYNEELRYLREAGKEFADAFPKIAARLGMESLEVADPYVERLLEGCAFLAARIQLKQDAEFPRFSNRLLELVYPNFLAPVPSMLVAQIQPVADANLLKGPLVPRGAALTAPPGEISRTRCEFRSVADLQLTPLSTASAEYFLNVADLGLSAFRFETRPRCGIRVRLRVPAGMSIASLEIDTLRFYLGGQVDVAMRIHELLLCASAGVLVSAPGRGPEVRRTQLAADAVSAPGYDDASASLPVTHRGFAGTRLLQEYFAFPERFLFIDVEGVREALRGIQGNEAELVLLFNRPGEGLDGLVDAGNFLLHCVPAVNLFAKRADRIALDQGSKEFHVVPDRTVPLDYEVYDITSVSGHDASGSERAFAPLFAPDHRASPFEPAYFTLWREPRLMSERARRDGPRSGYIGSEVFVSIVDPNEAPYGGDLRQLGVMTRCTNRDLPLFIPAGSLANGFSFDAGLPLEQVRVVAGPSRPHTALREGGVAWRLINLLSLNYLSLLDASDGEEGAAAVLRDLLSRFPMGQEPVIRRQIESLQQVRVAPIVRRHPGGGPIAFSRGIEITLSVDELGHEGGSAVLFGAALHQYLARHVSMNSFVETVLVSLNRGTLMRWAPARGLRAVI
ncbi:MAG: type VI secretion system baseplate subunit TssF [Pseudomonadota bacterium]|nr:type VI secretion system baseplate subunit TssF [Pseudomonadota bacterium]